jgi:gentisate 1,2-dioxygenase
VTIETTTSTPAGTGGVDFDSPRHQARLAELYRDFDAVGMTPLWRTREGLMPFAPEPRAVPHIWRWAAVPAGRPQRRTRAGRPGR